MSKAAGTTKSGGGLDLRSLGGVAVDLACELTLMLCVAFAGQYLSLITHWGYGVHHQFTCGLVYALVGAILVRRVRRSSA